MRFEIPKFSGLIAAGFPSPADDFMEGRIDLNRELIKNPAATFFARAKGESMVGLGIGDGDLLVIDRSIRAASNAVAVCHVEGGFTVKQLRFDKDGCWLLPANPLFKPRRVTEEDDCVVWGVVTHVIKTLRPVSSKRSQREG